MTGAASGPTVGVLGQVGYVHGFLYGQRQPVLMALVGAAPGLFTSEDAAALDHELQASLTQALGREIEPPAAGAAAASPVFDRLLGWLQKLQRAAGLPVFDTGLALGPGPAPGSVWIAAPAVELAPAVTEGALRWLASAMDAWRRTGTLTEPMAAFGELWKEMRDAAPKRSNVLRFHAAALEREIPFRLLTEDIVLYGQGRRSRRMVGTLTDRASAMAVTIARNKVLAASVMKRAGVPVPAHRPAQDEAQAVAAAEALGYPVVVKPADSDGGHGVAPDLRSPEAVRAAFAAAREISGEILVEKHVPGRDYRLVVMDGEMIWAVERVPGGVTGDGASTVRMLLDQMNADPRRGSEEHLPLRPVPLDDEAAAMLAETGLTPDSIPEAGRFVRLRRAANIASGGVPVAVNDQVHPDNARLAIRATQAAGLDISGVDLLIPDISRSWRETGAAICDLNAEPSLGMTTAPHLYGQLLDRLVPGRGRIPIAVIVGEGEGAALAGKVAEGLGAAGMTVGFASRDGVRIGGDLVAGGPLKPFASQILIEDAGVDAIVLHVGETSLLQTGLPFDRFDALAFAGPVAHGGPGGPSAVARQMLHALWPACRGIGLGLYPVEGAEQLPPGKGRWTGEAVDAEEALARILASLQEADRRYSGEAEPG